MRAKHHQEPKQPTINLVSGKIAPGAEEQLEKIAKRKSSMESNALGQSMMSTGANNVGQQINLNFYPQSKQLQSGDSRAAFEASILDEFLGG